MPLNGDSVTFGFDWLPSVCMMPFVFGGDDDNDVVVIFVSFVFKLSYVLNGRVISFEFDAVQMFAFPFVDIVGIFNCVYCVLVKSACCV